MTTRWKFALALFVAAGLVAACAVKEPPKTADMVEDALPPTTEVSAEWTAPAGDTGQVDDGWLATFEDPELEEWPEPGQEEEGGGTG